MVQETYIIMKVVIGTLGDKKAMSKRNFILLIIILIIVLIISLGILYFRQTPTPATESGEITFGSIFNPFGTSTSPTSPATTTAPTDISGYQPGEPTPETYVNLKKISSTPVAGFTVFEKERLTEVPNPTEEEMANASVTYNFGTTTLKNGSSGEAVVELQKFFNNTLGLSLELSGVLDTEMANVIKEWQTSQGLVADGIVGTRTKEKMYASVGQNTNPTPPETELVPALRYVDRVTGNIYETFVDKIQEKRFTTTTMPKIYEALLGNRGEIIVARYLKANNYTIETFIGELPKDVLGGDLVENEVANGMFLPDNTREVNLSPDTKSLFYLFNSEEGVVGTILNLTNNKKTQVFDSLFTEWLSWWPNSKQITLTTKPSYLAPGYMYLLDLNNKNFTQVMGEINGLTTLMSPDGKKILYADNNLLLGLYDTNTKTTETLGIKTLPEKCTWNSISTIIYCAVPKSAGGGQYPDVWYQGEVSFSDQIWKVGMETGNATILIDPATVAGEEIDGIKLALDDSENNLFFVNKKDSFLWSLELK